jgi:hypothetical protein
MGDTYNWCPPPGDVVVEGPYAVQATVAEAGPLRSRLTLAARYRWRDKPVAVTTTVELRAGESFARVAHSWTNLIRDHRVRAWFPLPAPADHSEAECAYAMVRRGLEAEGGPTEAPLPTFPSRRFVRAGGLTVAHEGLLEYELVDVHDGRAGALAVTLLRCTGLLSQGPMATRPLPAGPIMPLAGPQQQGPVAVRYVVARGDVDPYALVADAFVPLLATTAGGGSRRAAGTELEVEGAEVAAVVRCGAALHVRVFNPTAEEVDVRIPGRRGWLVDLRGRAVIPFDDHFPLAAWRIATAALT